MADRYLSLLLRLPLFPGVTTTYTRHGRNTFGSRGYNRRDNIFVFSWKSEAVWYSDHDRRYLFIPKQAPLPPPRVYLSATSLLPLPSLLFSSLLYLSASLSLSLFSPLFFLERAAPHLQLHSRSSFSSIGNRGYGHRGAWWHVEGYRTIGEGEGR